MMQKYNFFGEEPIEFDDEKSVKDLIQYAFDQFDYYEPAGMEIVTLFQPHSPLSHMGWFTTDTNRKCSDEILNRDYLCFAYYMPNVFYFAEGGWGHHMKELGNHPDIPDPIQLRLHLEDHFHRVIINGNYCFHDVIHYLKKTQYISEECNKVRVLFPRTEKSYIIHFGNKIMNLKLSEFENAVTKRNDDTSSDYGLISCDFY